MSTTNQPESAPAISPRISHSHFRWENLAVLAAFGLLSTRLLLLISRYAVNVFFMDQWDFNEATLFQKHSLWEMFRWQHGPHRQGLGALISFFIEPLFQWNSRTESFLVGAIVIFAAAGALWLKYRLFGSFSIFDVCIPLILFTPLQYETLFITANLAHGPLPLVLVVLFCLGWTVRNVPARLTLILLINFLAIYTGFGFFLGAITPFLLVADYGFNLRHLPRGTLFFSFSFLLALASFASFFINYRHETSVDCVPNLLQAPLEYLRFVFLMFANLFGIKGTSWLPALIGALILAALLTSLVAGVATLASRNENNHKAIVIVTLIAFCLLFSVNAAYGRSCLGVQVAQASRYVIYMECGLLGLYFSLADLPRSTFRRVSLLLLTAALIAALPLRSADESVMRFVSSAKKNWKACYLQNENVRGCNHAVGYGVYPNLDRNLEGKLLLLKQNKQNLYAGQ